MFVLKKIYFIPLHNTYYVVYEFNTYNDTWTQKSALRQSARSAWQQPRGEFWLPSAGTWRLSGDWRLNQTVCFWWVCRSERGWELSGSGRVDKPGGTTSSDISDRLRESRDKVNELYSKFPRHQATTFSYMSTEQWCLPLYLYRW